MGYLWSMVALKVSSYAISGSAALACCLLLADNGSKSTVKLSVFNSAIE